MNLFKTAINIGSSTAASSLRSWKGLYAAKATRQPKQLLELYEFEGCPYCRLVRETLTDLDLDAMIYPCPRGGTRFRDKARELGGKAQFPYLVDPNTGTAMYESGDIIEYLYATYTNKTAPSGLLRRTAAVATSSLASATRIMQGILASPSKAPEKPLELYSFESSPFSRPVRERLSELEIPYLLRNSGKGSNTEMGPPWIRERFFADVPVTQRNRKRLLELTGRMQFPYLVDPNTGMAMFESVEIIDYLNREYSL